MLYIILHTKLPFHQPFRITGLTPSITHYCTHLLLSKVIVREVMTGRSTSVLVPCSYFGF